MGGKDTRDRDMDKVGQDLGEPIKGEVGDNLQTNVERVGGSLSRKHLAESSDDDEDMAIAKDLQEEANKRQEKNHGRVFGDGSHFLQQYL